MGLVELVLFDLDGTLLDGSGLPAAMRATCEAISALTGASADDLVAANTGAWQRRWPAVEDDYMLGGREGDVIVRETWRDALAACGVEVTAALDAAVAEWATHERASLRLFSDVLPLLADLDRRGVRIGMITNGAGVVQRAKLDAVRLTGRLDPLIVSGEVGVKKPDPRIFEIALHAAGAAPHETWFVGDHQWHDMQGALEVGMRAAWLDRAGGGPDPDGPRPTRVIGSLAGLVPV